MKLFLKTTVYYCTDKGCKYNLTMAGVVVRNHSRRTWRSVHFRLLRHWLVCFLTCSLTCRYTFSDLNQDEVFLNTVTVGAGKNQTFNSWCCRWWQSYSCCLPRGAKGRNQDDDSLVNSYSLLFFQSFVTKRLVVIYDVIIDDVVIILSR